MKASEIYKSSYCSVERWPIKPEPHTITDAGTDTNEMSKKDTDLIIWIELDGEDLRYRVNASNTRKLIEGFGDDIPKWIGKTVAISRYKMVIKGKDSWASLIEPIGGKRGKASKPKK